MRVALISHDIYPGDGQGRVNYELARYLLSQGVTVDLLADRVDEHLVDLGATWRPIHPGGQSVNLIRVWRFKHLVNRYLDAHASRYDVLLACGVVLDRPHTVNVAHFVHGTWIDSPFHAAHRHRAPQKWYYRLYSLLNAHWERAILHQAEVVVAVSDNVGRDLVQLGLPSERLCVIPNGVDTDEFSPGPSRRAALNLPGDVPLGLFVGDLRSPIKNLDTALRALVDIPDLHLAVAGTLDGSPYPSLALDLGVANRTHFLGFQRDVVGLMRSADFFVLPSHQDAFGLVVTEAMSTGLPVIVSRSVGASCLVTPEVGIVIDPPDNVEALKTAFTTLASDPDRRAQMGRAARETALNCSWSRMGSRYLELFHEVGAPSHSGLSQPASKKLA
ncbi:glycosyl transferase family 1 [Salinibacter sp. 10B]|uniref:glycosyltransferase family 4 protein n=1 Tax=Salinibacter sp. 10B TaxID=1923971 RepID=UPI000CF50052|nr:glycosyltransferase family 4 protein [Salinibacter sp. 10B]PQJ34590.1 glycosyl transferase family 1 [Salinibacter sp. 10B]